MRSFADADSGAGTGPYFAGERRGGRVSDLGRERADVEDSGGA